MSTETQGSLLVLFGFLAGFVGVVIRAREDLQLIGNVVAVASVGIVVVGCVMSIAGRSQRKGR